MKNTITLITLFLINSTYSFQFNKLMFPVYQKSIFNTQIHSKNINSLDTNLTKLEDCIFNFECNYEKTNSDISIININQVIKVCERKISYISIGLLLGIVTSEYIKIDGAYLTSVTFFQNLNILAYYLLPLFLITFFHEVKLDNANNYENQTQLIDYVGKTSIISLIYIFNYEYRNQNSIITESDRVVFDMIKLYIDILFKLKFDNI